MPNMYENYLQSCFAYSYNQRTFIFSRKMIDVMNDLLLIVLYYLCYNESHSLFSCLQYGLSNNDRIAAIII